ncbi:MAG: GIY-YIG nuclease family protein, partial [Enterococcus faecium]
LSTNPEISKIENLYKIGFTRNDVNKRIMNAENEVTYLNAPVQRVLSVEVKNVNAQKLERTLHHSFEDRQVIFQDSAYKKANEWYVVSIEEIENRMNEIIAGLQK